MEEEPKLKIMEGYNICPEWLKESFRKAVKNICEVCHKHEKIVGKLSPHRMIRRIDGGTYAPHNIKMCCSKCHKMIHSLEKYR